MKRKRFTMIATICVILAILIACVAMLKIRDNVESKNGITRAEAAKMIALACVTDEELGEKTENWYERYVKYMNDNEYMNINKPTANLTYSDVIMFLKKIGKTTADVELEQQKDNDVISKNDFINLYIDVISIMDINGQVKTISAGIVGTPSNVTQATEWQAYTTDGIYNFEGLVLDNAIDKMTRLVVKGNEILCVQAVLDDDVTYKNVWVVEGKNDILKVYAYGVLREFSVKNLSQDVKEVLADVHLSNRKVTGIDVKTDTIQGKVLSISNEYVEVEGYGRVDLEKDYKIYNIYNGFEIKGYTDIVVGYSLQNFIVANGKICGAIISQPLKIDNIRILIKTTDFDSLFHSSVSLTSDNAYTLYYGEQEEKHNAGDVVSLSKNSEYLTEGRVKMITDNNGLICINSISRSQGYPQYEGAIEVSTSDNGLLITNEVSIEKYLKKVVPSEMPVSYGVEALKVQAVCARSYAYKQLTNSYYGAYGAHMDDSTLFQVYNNVNDSENSNTAIAETNGQVLTYNDQVVETYYYSTSCGYTTDVSIWGSNPENYPYFASHSVSQEEQILDLTDEATFTSFIKGSSFKDYDKDYPLYRWIWNVTVAQLSDSFNSKLAARYKAYPAKIQTMNKDGTFVSKSISTVGNITDIKVNARVSGGAITNLTIIGTKATVRIDGEGNIRYLLGVSDVPLITSTGGLKSMASLPSTFCIFEQTHTGKELTGFTITGGGYGHGIGMSQNAVCAMTNRSMTYADILQFFYSGTEISILN